MRKIGSRYFKRCDGANDRRDGAVDGAVYGRVLIRCASKLSCKKSVERHLARCLMHFCPEIRANAGVLNSENCAIRSGRKEKGRHRRPFFEAANR
ncbi:MAG TPA: hypothetical protein VF928_08270 [Usitatibacteraceae bacterium]